MTGQKSWYNHPLGHVDLQMLEDAFSSLLEQRPEGVILLGIGGHRYHLKVSVLLSNFMFARLSAGLENQEMIIRFLSGIELRHFIPFERVIMLADEVDRDTERMIHIDYDVDFSRLDQEEADLIDKVFDLSIRHRKYSLAELAAERNLSEARVREQFYATIAKIRKAYPGS